MLGEEVRAADGNWMAAVRSVVAQVLDSGDVPGVMVAVARDGEEPEYLGQGTDGAGEPLTPETLLPVASVTKLATALAVLRLVGDGALALDEPLARHAPEAAAAVDAVTMRTLLCHTAGLPPDLRPESAPYTAELTWGMMAQACLQTPPAAPPQTRVEYSNTGYGLLAIVVERVTGRPFNQVVAELVFGPLGIEGYLGVEPPRPVGRITGSLGGHVGTELEPYNSRFWRSVLFPWGGLVTTVGGALALVRAFMGVPAGFLPGWLLAEATRDQTGGLPGRMIGVGRWPHNSWGLGPELKGAKGRHWTPAEASAGSFGHAGASGCLAWADPAAGVAWAILGPRTLEGWSKDWPAIGVALLNKAGNLEER
jgi:CubicO group peptidase (beta-lactamase class C family)